jgi:hypothetical protein
LVAENERLQQEIQYLRRENDDLDLMVQQYDHTIQRIMDGLRVYAVCDLFGSGGECCS